MAANGTSNRIALRYIAEVTENETPATPVFKPLRYSTENLQYNITNATSKEVRDDRSTADLIRVSASSGGDVGFEMHAETFDDFIQAALCGTWEDPEVDGIYLLKNGTVSRSFTIQKYFADLAAPVYQNFKGQKINTMSLDFQSGSILTGSFGFMGMEVEAGTAAITGQTVAAANTHTPMNSVTDVTNIEEDGVASVISYKNITLEINNNIRAQDAIGSLYPIGQALGTMEITGSFEAYFSDLVMYNRLLNGTAFALGFRCQDGLGRFYDFTLPKVKLESGTPESGGLDTDVMMKGQWRAIYDSATSCMIQVERKTTI